MYKNKEKNQRDLAREVVTNALNGRIWNEYQEVVSLFECNLVSDVFLLMKATIVNRIFRYAQAFKEFRQK